MPDRNTDLYNMVTLRNPMDKDFLFGYDNKGKTIIGPDGKTQIPNPAYNKLGNYVIKTGETRNFPKFIARVGMKHLIDKILLDKDPEGKLMNIQEQRDSVAELVLVKEEKYDRPVVPTDTEIVDQMNVTTDMDRILAKNTARLKKEEIDSGIVPEPDVEEVVDVTEAEEFDGLKIDKDDGLPVDVVDGTESGTAGTPSESEIPVEPELPTRQEMLKYAIDKLNMDFSAIIKAKGKNEGKTVAEVFVLMNDEELHKELGLGD